jgi:hypothetical protein
MMAVDGSCPVPEVRNKARVVLLSTGVVLLSTGVVLLSTGVVLLSTEVVILSERGPKRFSAWGW